MGAPADTQGHQGAIDDIEVGQPPVEAIPKQLIDPEIAKDNSRLTLKAYCNAALIAEQYSVMPSTDTQELLNQIAAQCRKVQNGELGRAGTILISQALSLDVIFAKLALNASVNLNENVHAAEIYLRLALKAQSQCRSTLETLVMIKNPPVIFAKQANIAQGHQQINNGNGPAPARVKNIESKPNELLEHDHGQWLDTGTASETGRSNKAMATVAVINGSKDRRRKGKRAA